MSDFDWDELDTELYNLPDDIEDDIEFRNDDDDYYNVDEQQIDTDEQQANDDDERRRRRDGDDLDDEPVATPQTVIYYPRDVAS